MFYKDGYLTKEQKDYFENSPEFIYALYEKMSLAPNNYLGAFIGIDKNEKELISIPELISTYDDGKFSGHININGAYNNSAYQSELKKMQEKNDNCINLKIVALSKEEYKNKFILNEEKLKKAKEILSDFFNLKETGTLKDKNGEVYHFKIIQNADPSIGSTLIVDNLLLLKENGEEIGFIKVKYTTEEILEKLNVSEQEKKDNVFLNIAGVDFSKIREDFRNLGLGYSMYFQMAQYLTKNNIYFRQSSLNSEKAVRLWNGINQHWAKFILIEKGEVSKKTVSFLKIGEDCMLSFENNRPIITKKNRV